MDEKGQHIKRLTSNHRSHSPSWSPDGSRIAFLQDSCTPASDLEPKYRKYEALRDFLNGSRELRWLDLDGGDPSSIAAMSADAQDTLWLPSGNQIGVRMSDKGSLQVLIKGGHIPPNHQSAESLKQFLEIEEPQVSLVSVRPGARLLELNPPVDNFLPTFIAFFDAFPKTDFLRPSNNMQYAADLGESLQVLSMNGETASSPVPAYDIAWSHDAKRIAYSTFTGDDYSVLYVVDARAGEANTPRALTDQALDAHGPAWSPDGSKIAFIGLWKDSSQIFIINTDGSNVVQLSRDANMRCNHLSWSPDGKSIVAACIYNLTFTFAPLDRVIYQYYRSKIYLFDSGRPGANPRLLTPDCGVFAYNLCGTKNPSFAPAGKVLP
jgi:Tol biopolymer transport system component